MRHSRQAMNGFFRAIDQLLADMQRSRCIRKAKEAFLQKILSYIKIKLLEAALLSEKMKSYFRRLFGMRSRYAQNIPHFHLRGIRHAREKRTVSSLFYFECSQNLGRN